MATLFCKVASTPRRSTSMFQTQSNHCYSILHKQGVSSGMLLSVLLLSVLLFNDDYAVILMIGYSMHKVSGQQCASINTVPHALQIFDLVGSSREKLAFIIQSLAPCLASSPPVMGYIVTHPLLFTSCCPYKFLSFSADGWRFKWDMCSPVSLLRVVQGQL